MVQYPKPLQVLHSGSWNNNAFDSRASNRFYFTPGLRYYVVGFRCARVPRRLPLEKETV